jgi:hypothetical protein
MRVLLLAILSSALATSLAAQDNVSAPEPSPVNYDQHAPPSRLGLGLQVGDPTGISVKRYRSASTRKGILGTVDAYSFLAAWNLDQFFYLSAHALKENALEDSPLNYYIGPGVIAGVHERSSTDDDFVVGVSAEGGLNFFTERFEVFLGLTPWFRVVPEPGLFLGGGVGLRFYP